MALGSSDTETSDPAAALLSPSLKVVLPIAVGLAVWFLGATLEPQQRSVASVFALTVALWITEALPLAVTALISTALLVIVAGVDEKAAFAAYGDPIIPLFIGSFLLAKAMEVNRLNERMAWWTLRQRWASSSASRLLLAIGAISCIISLFVSNTATTAMLLPIAASIVAAMRAEGTRFATAFLLMLTWGSSVAVGVPVGTPPNLIAMGLIEKATGERIGFLQWMGFGLPITFAMVFLAWAFLRFSDLKISPSTADASALAEEKLAELQPLSAGEKATMGAFFVALTLWIAPDLLAALFEVIFGAVPPWIKWMQGHVTATVAALIGASLLFILPAKNRPTGHALSWREGSRIDWGIVLLFGGGIALGQAMFSSGLAKHLGEMAAQASGAHSLWAITALCIGAAILLSELASNTAAATTLVPVAIGLAQGAGVSPIAPALGVALGASFGFMLPVSTPPNAIVYSSGHVASGQMARRGAVIDVLGFIVIFTALRLLLPLLGLV